MLDGRTSPQQARLHCMQSRLSSRSPLNGLSHGRSKKASAYQHIDAEGGKLTTLASGHHHLSGRRTCRPASLRMGLMAAPALPSMLSLPKRNWLLTRYPRPLPPLPAHLIPHKHSALLNRQVTSCYPTARHALSPVARRAVSRVRGSLDRQVGSRPRKSRFRADRVVSRHCDRNLLWRTMARITDSSKLTARRISS
jgi:hypothetical protein